MITWDLLAILLLAGTGAFLLLGGWLAAVESASLTANREVLRTLEASGDPDAADALRMLANARRILAGSFMGSLVALLASAGLLRTALTILLPRILNTVDLPPALWWLSSSALWTVLLLVPAYLFFGELLPRQWCRRRPDSFLRLSSGPMRWVLALWLPIADSYTRLLSRALRAIGLQGGLEPVRLTREDLRDLVEDASEDEAESSLPGTPRGMIRSILSLQQTLVREVMRPIGQVVAIRLGDMTPRQVIEFARRHSFTRYPVYRERMIDLIGYINIYDLLAGDLEGTRLEDFLHEPLFLPETARADTLLHEFMRQKTQCAIAFDEHGSASGWVTREDVLEEIVGDLDVEGDPAMRRIRQEAEGIYLVDPGLDVDDLNRLLDVSMDKLHCETVGGYVYSVLGRVPLPGERIYLRRWILEVVEIDHHIIRSLRLFRRPERLPDPE